MHLSHTIPHRLPALRPQTVFCFGAGAVRHPHIARHTRVPSIFGPRKRFAARVCALFVRMHTFYMKFLQGHL